MALKPVVDGFMYNSSLLLLPQRFFPFALGEMEILRRAHNLRPRWWCIPDDFGEPIAPYDTFQFQVEVAPGSYLFGMMFEVISPGITTDMLISVVDSCTGIPLFNDFVNCGGVTSNFNAKMLPTLLTKPRLILEPGLVNVEIANRTGSNRTCQLVLMFAEPCRVFQE